MSLPVGDQHVPERVGGQVVAARDTGIAADAGDLAGLTRFGVAA